MLYSLSSYSNLLRYYLFIYLILRNAYFFISQLNSCTKKLVCQKYSTLIYVNKYTMRKRNLNNKKH